MLVFGSFNTLGICKGSRIKVGMVAWHFHRIKCPDLLECKYPEAMISDKCERLIVHIAACVQQKSDS